MAEFVRIKSFQDVKAQLDNRSHLWILLDGKVEVAPIEEKKDCHCHYWGEQVWEISERGYVWQDAAVVSCHASVRPDLEKKLAQKLPDIVYLKC